MRTNRSLSLTIAVFAFVLAAAMLVHRAGAAGTHQVLYNFTGGNDGGNAATGLVFDNAGNAYGTTVQGGLYGCGTIFKLTANQQGQWMSKTLWHFTCGSDGKNPHGGVTFDTHGNLYGTTTSGGNGGLCTGDGCGVVFRLGHRGGLQPIYSFTGGTDGFGPGNPVAFDTAGNLYGTAPDGGLHKKGVVYQLSLRHNVWTQTVIHAFTGFADGATGSLGPLLLDSAGVIYGVTETGGNHQAGTAYKITPGSGGTWTFKTIYAFKGWPDAGYPYGGLITDGHNLFGTTYYAGANMVGSVFELSPNPNGTYRESVLYSFMTANDGNSPASTLFRDNAGNLFGTAAAGGNTCGCGTIFKLAAGTWAESTLHAFGATQTDGAYPLYGLTLGPNGNLFTSTNYGGLYGQGTVYGLKP